MKVTPTPASGAADLLAMVSKALREAHNLGQRYWQQADSEYISQHKKADDTRAKFLALVEETCAALAAGQAYPTIGDLCARIKAADDAAADRDYMLDSNDCIAVLRGEWKGPLTMDKPERASHGQAPATQQVGEPECYKWEHYCRWGHGWGWGECESEYDPRLPENKQYHTEDFNDPEQVRNFRALYRHTPPSLPTAQADSVPAAQQAKSAAYAALPEYGINTASHAHFRVLGFTADQMRAFADATHALRATHGQAPTGANGNAELVTLIAECRDAFPIPAHGDPIENYWSAAIEDPANVPAYLQEIAKRKQADSVQEDAADPLQGAANWLAEAHGQFSPVVLSGCLMIGYNRAKRLHDVALAARKQGASHDR